MRSQRKKAARSPKTPIRGVDDGLRTGGSRKDSTQGQPQIQTLFLRPQASYALSEAARIVGISVGRLRREAEADQREAYRSNGTWCFTWRQVAFIAMRRWTLAEIHEALGGDAMSALPALLSMQTLTVQLPEYLVRAMETVAAEDGLSVDDWLRLELVDFAGTVVDQMEEIHPGFRQAYLFPGQEQSGRRG